MDLQMNGNVYFTQGPTTKLEISAKESIHSILETTVIDNRLVIRYKNGKTYDEDESIRINITAPDVNSLSLNTSGNIYATNDILQSVLTLRSYGSGSIQLKRVFVNSIDAESNQSGTIKAIDGTVSVETLQTYGSGKIDMLAVSARTATAHAKGSGDIKLKVLDSLDVTVDGSGSVYYSGYPSITTHISGTGNLVHL
ncbi:MAG: head GIN domain-containing protein [Ferruginibacter sp.]